MTKFANLNGQQSSRVARTSNRQLGEILETRRVARTPLGLAALPKNRMVAVLGGRNNTFVVRIDAKTARSNVFALMERPNIEIDEREFMDAVRRCPRYTKALSKLYVQREIEGMMYEVPALRFYLASGANENGQLGIADFERKVLRANGSDFTREEHERMVSFVHGKIEGWKIIEDAGVPTRTQETILNWIRGKVIWPKEWHWESSNMGLSNALEEVHSFFKYAASREENPELHSAVCTHMTLLGVAQKLIQRLCRPPAVSLTPTIKKPICDSQERERRQSTRPIDDVRQVLAPLIREVSETHIGLKIDEVHEVPKTPAPKGESVQSGEGKPRTRLPHASFCETVPSDPTIREVSMKNVIEEFHLFCAVIERIIGRYTYTITMDVTRATNRNYLVRFIAGMEYTLRAGKFTDDRIYEMTKGALENLPRVEQLEIEKEETLARKLQLTKAIEDLEIRKPNKWRRRVDERKSQISAARTRLTEIDGEIERLVPEGMRPFSELVSFRNEVNRSEFSRRSVERGTR